MTFIYFMYLYCALGGSGRPNGLPAGLARWPVQ